MWSRVALFAVCCLFVVVVGGVESGRKRTVTDELHTSGEGSLKGGSKEHSSHSLENQKEHLGSGLQSNREELPTGSSSRETSQSGYKNGEQQFHDVSTWQSSNRPGSEERSSERSPGESSLKKHSRCKESTKSIEGGETKGKPIHDRDFPSPKDSKTNEHDPQSTKEEDDDEEGEKEVCYPPIGCFSLKAPWKSFLRPVPAPDSPEAIGTTIYFYSRANLEKQKNITLHPHIDMGGAQFNPNKITAIIVHGFSSSGKSSWMRDMKNVYLRKVDGQVMLVDWEKGAGHLNYFQVAGNTRVVGRQLGIFVNYLKEHYGANPQRFHLIGHSLGAQICSYLAKAVPRIARLTALDPAQPAFERFDKAVRLDKSDADFIDVVHTDARPFFPTLGFGMIKPHGHVDFYMNGGFEQPGCISPSLDDIPTINSILDLAKFPVEVWSKLVSCAHGRSYEYLIEAFNETEKCIFWGHKVGVMNVIKSVTNSFTQSLFKKYVALSSSCSTQDCIPLGFATKKSPNRGVFVITTNARPPYCIHEPGVPPEVFPSEQRTDESFLGTVGKLFG